MPASAEPTSVRSAPPRASRLPLTLIIAVLLLLGALPIIGDRYIDSYRVDVRDLVEPARNLTTDIHVSLALGSTALRDYLNTGETDFLTLYDTTSARERDAYQKLAPLAARLDTAVLHAYDLLRVRETAWHGRVSELLRRHPRDLGAIRRLLADEQLYENAVTAAARLDNALAHAASLRRERIDRAERIIDLLSIALATLALSAVLITLLLGRRLQNYALATDESRRQLERALDSRARLARGITHDLKNPLNAILGNIQLLQENVVGELNPAQQERVSRLEKSASSMQGMIESLLQLESANSGQLHIKTRPVDLGALVEEVAENHRAVIESAGLKLGVDVAAQVGRVETDPDLVRRILDNLLSNAVKYTDTGCVRVQAAPVESSERGPGQWIAIEVQDSGRGIPQDQLERIFEEFSRLETGSIPGFGLGLAVSLRLARLLGGDLTAQSEEGKGSTFTLWLPRSYRTVSAGSTPR